MANGAGARDRVKLRYFFSMEPQVDPSPIGDVPGGFRMDLKYSGPVMTKAAYYEEDWHPAPPPPPAPARARSQRPRRTPSAANPYTYAEIRRARRDEPPSDPDHVPNLYELRSHRAAQRVDWFGLDGQIASGGDWVTVRQDGVATFDGRITIKADDSFLVDAVVLGVVDLRNPPDTPMPERNEGRSKIYDNWLLGNLRAGGEMPTIGVVLPVRFEAARVAGTWAKEGIAAASEGYWKYERLVRGQFVAMGVITLQRSRYSPIASVSLDVYQVHHDPPWTAAAGGST